MQTTVNKTDNGIRVEGILVFDTVVLLAHQSRSILSGMEAPVIDLSAVTHADSAGAALLCEWKRAHPKVCFLGMPDQLKNMIEISKLTDILSESS